MSALLRPRQTAQLMAYGELMVAVLAIGALGFALDLAARLAHRCWKQPVRRQGWMEGTPTG